MSQDRRQNLDSLYRPDKIVFHQGVLLEWIGRIDERQHHLAVDNHHVTDEVAVGEHKGRGTQRGQESLFASSRKSTTPDPFVSFAPPTADFRVTPLNTHWGRAKRPTAATQAVTISDEVDGPSFPAVCASR